MPSGNKPLSKPMLTQIYFSYGVTKPLGVENIDMFSDKLDGLLFCLHILINLSLIVANNDVISIQFLKYNISKCQWTYTCRYQHTEFNTTWLTFCKRHFQMHSVYENCCITSKYLWNAELCSHTWRRTSHYLNWWQTSLLVGMCVIRPWWIKTIKVI